LPVINSTAVAAEGLEKLGHDPSFRPVSSSPSELAAVAEARRRDRISLLQSQI